MVSTHSDVMLDEALQRRWVKMRDDIRKLDPARQRELQKTAARAISKMATTPLVVDTHATVRTSRSSGLPTWVLDELKPELILIVETRPNEIIRRRNADKSRQRDAQDAMGVQEHQEINKAICMAYAAHTGATVKRLHNSTEGLMRQSLNWWSLCRKTEFVVCLAGVRIVLLTISGFAGSGKTTVARGLSRKLGYAHVSAGDAFRRVMSLEQLSKLAETEPEIDKMVDQRQAELAQSCEDAVVDGRLSGWVLKADIAVWLKAPLEVRAERIAGREGKLQAAALNETRLRDSSETVL